MGSLLIEYGFGLTRSRPEFYLLPGALFFDTFFLPILAVSELPYQLWEPVIKPCFTVMANILNLVPQEVIEFACKTAIFLIPIATTAVLVYLGSITFGSRSLVSDANVLKDSLYAVCEKAFEGISPMVVLALAGGIALGAAFGGDGKGV